MPCFVVFFLRPPCGEFVGFFVVACAFPLWCVVPVFRRAGCPTVARPVLLNQRKRTRQLPVGERLRKVDWAPKRPCASGRSVYFSNPVSAIANPRGQVLPYIDITPGDGSVTEQPASASGLPPPTAETAFATEVAKKNAEYQKAVKNASGVVQTEKSHVYKGPVEQESGGESVASSDEKPVEKKKSRRSKKQDEGNSTEQRDDNDWYSAKLAGALAGCCCASFGCSGWLR